MVLILKIKGINTKLFHVPIFYRNTTDFIASTNTGFSLFPENVPLIY